MNTHKQSCLRFPFKIDYSLEDCVVTSVFTIKLMNTNGKEEKCESGGEKKTRFDFCVSSP